MGMENLLQGYGEFVAGIWRTCCRDMEDLLQGYGKLVTGVKRVCCRDSRYVATV